MRIAIAAALAGALVPACGRARDAKTLVFCSEGNPESLNPQIVTTTTGINAGRPFFNNLVEFPPGSTEPRPGARRNPGRSRTTGSNTPFICAAA